MYSNAPGVQIDIEGKYLPNKHLVTNIKVPSGEYILNVEFNI